MATCPGSVNTLLASDEPPPYSVINPDGKSALVLVCDHASNRVPRALNDLGLDAEELDTHIAWDPGAALVAKSLSLKLDAPLILSGYSRLVIDCNRPLGKPSVDTGTECGYTNPG